MKKLGYPQISTFLGTALFLLVLSAATPAQSHRQSTAFRPAIRSKARRQQEKTQ